MNNSLGFGFTDLISMAAGLFQGANATNEMDEAFVANYFAQEDIQTIAFQQQLESASQMEQNKVYLSVALFIIIVSLILYIVLKK